MDSLKTVKLPLATVVMVVYNSERYIAEAIESVLCQSHENLELLICDDCSTDNTWNIIQGYSDSRIRAFRNPDNIGEYPNRNQAIELAKGEYLIFIDGDDLLYPHGLEFMVRMLEAFPNSAMAMARPWNEKIIYPVEFTPRQVYLSEYLGRGIVAINFAHLLMRTSVLRSVGGLSTEYLAGDVHIQHLIGQSHKCLLISDGLAWWRRTPGQQSDVILNRHFGVPESYQFRHEFLEHELCPLTKEESRIAYSNLYGGFTRMVLRYVLKGCFKHAFYLLNKAKVPMKAWSYIFIPMRRNYMNDVTAANPIKAEFQRNPLAKIPDSIE